MEELQLLVQTVAGLPTLTLWVLAGYLIYKLAILGSLYGTVRYLADKFVEWRSKPVVYKIGARAINEDVMADLANEINRISTGTYIHASDVDRLRKAINAEFKND